MAVNLSPVGGVAAQFFTNNGTPLSGGKLFTYAAGTTTPLATYTSSNGATAWTNPIVFDSAGRVPSGGEIWLTDGLSYKFILKDSNDVLIATYDNITGINSNFVNYTNQQEIQTATAGQTVFTLTTMQYLPGTGSLSVFVDGVNQYGPGAQYAFLETDATTVTFVNGLHIGASVKFTTSAINASSYGDAFQISYTPPFTGSAPTNIGDKLAQYVSVKDFGAVGDGSTNDTGSIQAAIDAAAGRLIYFPAGTYRVTSTLTYQPAAYVSSFGAGLKIIGDGPLKTVFDNQVNGPLFSMTTGSTGVLFQGSLGAVLEGFTIKRTTPTSNGVGIYMTAAYNPTVRNVHIIGMSSHGIQIPCILGDNDGSNMVCLDHVRIENCAGWGVKADGDAGFNETSFIYMQQVFIQACGTASGAYQPPSGGMAWKGQILTMQQCAFTLNENCALWIPGASGLGQTVDLQDTTFENNKARSIFSRGVAAFKARNIQIYNNNSYVSTVGCEFEGGSFTIRQIDIDGVVVRATSGNNPYTAFKISGANAELNTCRVRNVVWDNFDYAGQTRFDGWQFDPVPNNCVLTVSSSTNVVVQPNQYIGEGNKIPLRLQGPNNQSGVGVASTSGEWVTLQVSNSGLTVPLAGVSASTRYWCYLYDNDGVPTIEISNSASQVTDTTSGYAVKSGDATRYYVGSIYGGGSSATVATTGIGWLNPTLVANGTTNANAYLWSDSSGRLRIKSNGSLPASDTDGTVVGTQT